MSVSSSGSTLLIADALAETHPELPDGWHSSTGRLNAKGWPWWCDACEGVSYLCYRCASCGRDLAGGDSR